MKDLIQCEYHGMSPSEWTEHFVEEEFTSLLAVGPRNSTMKLRAEKYSDKFEGKLIVFSDAGAFIVEDRSPDIPTLVKSLKKKMKAKLHKWKEVHHGHGHTRRVS